MAQEVGHWGPLQPVTMAGDLRGAEGRAEGAALGSEGESWEHPPGPRPHTQEDTQDVLSGRALGRRATQWPHVRELVGEDQHRSKLGARADSDLGGLCPGGRGPRRHGPRVCVRVSVMARQGSRVARPPFSRSPRNLGLWSGGSPCVLCPALASPEVTEEADPEPGPARPSAHGEPTGKPQAT